MKIAAVIEYCGSRFSGWQQQKHTTSIQQLVETALSKVADHDVKVYCAGRTDAGVHALNQVIHFETTASRPIHAWVLGSNMYLSTDISVLWAQQITDDFHARFSVIRRSYRYIILNRAIRPGLYQGLVTWEHQPLDVKSMRMAALDLIGEHDFTSYRAAGCQANTPVRVVYKLDVFRKGEYVVIDITANAFLHHMVRIIAGVLMAIGMGKEKTDWAKQVLEVRDRSKGGETSSANGLYLTHIEYPEEYQIPKPAFGSWPLIL